MSDEEFNRILQETAEACYRALVAIRKAMPAGIVVDEEFWHNVITVSSVAFTSDIPCGCRKGYCFELAHPGLQSQRLCQKRGEK